MPDDFEEILSTLKKEIASTEDEIMGILANYEHSPLMRVLTFHVIRASATAEALRRYLITSATMGEVGFMEEFSICMKTAAEVFTSKLN